jgi:probable phosphoglycerate mutase
MNGNLFAPFSPETANDWVTAHCDGGSRGNPGPAGYGAVIEDAQGTVLAELSEFVGIQTNNFAEYSGLLGVLKWAVQRNIKRLRVISDSELMVKQMQGKYKVASPILRPLYEEAKRLSHRVESFDMRHTLRGGNKVADRLANEAMDKGMGKPARQPVSATETVPMPQFRRPVSQPVSQPVSKSVSQPVSQPVGETGGVNRVSRVSAAVRQKFSKPATPPESETGRVSGVIGIGASAGQQVSRPVPVAVSKPAPPAVSRPVPAAVSKPAPPAAARPTPPPAAKPVHQVFEGYVKNGVIHLFEGELPEGIIVKVIRE